MMFHGSFGLSGGKQNKISLESVAAEALLARAASLQVTLVQLWRSDGFCSPSKGWLSVAAPPSMGWSCCGSFFASWEEPE